MKIREVTRHEWVATLPGRWRQGEHIALIGPTGTGKTGLACDLVTARAYVVALAIKRHDDTLASFRGFRIIKRWPPEYGSKRVILWVKPQSLGDIAKQRAEIIKALESIYLAGGWCVYFDDLSYVADQLRIKTPIVTFLNQGRSSGISAVCACTRPRKVPIEAFTQVRHVISLHYDDERELERIAEIAGIPRRVMFELNRELAIYPKGYSDFLSFGKGDIFIVRNKR